jgi:NADPH:quinone reductase-like Zn-dependent oxidoreductase
LPSSPPHVLEVKDVDQPVVKDTEVLVRIHATTLCAEDWRRREADPFVVRLAIKAVTMTFEEAAAVLFGAASCDGRAGAPR